MTEKEFLLGFMQLQSMPYAYYLRYDNNAELQQQMFWRLYGRESGTAWLKAVEWWITHEDHWPLPVRFTGLIRQFRPPTDAAHAAQLFHGVSIPVSQDALVAFAERNGITVFDAVRRWEEVAAEEAVRKTSSS